MELARINSMKKLKKFYFFIIPLVILSLSFIFFREPTKELSYYGFDTLEIDEMHRKNGATIYVRKGRKIDILENLYADPQVEKISGRELDTDEIDYYSKLLLTVRHVMVLSGDFVVDGKGYCVNITLSMIEIDQCKMVITIY